MRNRFLSLLFLGLLAVGCATDLNNRQRFMVATGSCGAVTAMSRAFIATPYALEVEEVALQSMKVAVNQCVDTLERVRPLLHESGEDSPEAQKIIDVSLDSVDAIARDVNATILPALED